MTTDANYSLDQMLPGVLHNAQNGWCCRSCGRRTDDAIIGHDGFCPIPALTRAIARIAADRADLAQAQADANRLRVAAEFNCEAMSEEDWPNECSGCGRVATLAGPECFCADCFRNHWAQAQAERDAWRTDCERLYIEKDSLVVSWHNAELREGNLRGELADIRQSSAALTVLLGTAQAERDAATHRADRAQSELAQLRAALAQAQAERDAANRAAYAAEALADERRDAATRRAEQAEAVVARLRKQREELHELILTNADGEWNNGEDDRAGALRDLVRGAIKRGLLDAAALAGPKGGPR